MVVCIACPEFADQHQIVNVNGLLDLCMRLLFLVAVDFLMNDHWTCFDYEHNYAIIGIIGHNWEYSKK